ncbi:8-oxo-dGTP pyrophosphatase MutT (NUDIX family) [Actinoplanes campanulatus]|uniref:8-oxo-dGTP pyrophosphatase MutT (NUDIX family) n=1 Tax=Actinoplanes campanulatus TaxID=113559 RepID=A0A7W5AJE1_9ACTN|nr:NUDIX domain-containing protein [Actinoplanes campanulatus]MBB3097009.1 8-oxo-dGTP pyrophosphatase MutT (NUDIX family) [Actinoplanes campanulatus]GGN15044.1 hypothetical protein GCM10010109_26690 [Actinoplanes campanulatus]GID37808.1 hypothetical protein Aca09nite_43140 [Actinoplanes campanulatus]
MLLIACTFVVDRDGALLLQLRDDKAPYFPNVWGLPGGAIEAGETPEQGAAMVFVPAAEVLDRPFTPGSAEMIERFLRSGEYASLT